MSQSLERPFAPMARISIAGVAARLGQGLIIAIDLLIEWAERRRDRQSLMALPDHLLRDIGLSRLDAYREADKPFWRP